jgi:hypothetical protein
MTAIMPRPIQLLDMLGTIRDHAASIEEATIAGDRDRLFALTKAINLEIDVHHDALVELAQGPNRERDAKLAEQLALYATELAARGIANSPGGAVIIGTRLAEDTKKIIPQLRSVAARIAHSAGVDRLDALSQN